MGNGQHWGTVTLCTRSMDDLLPRWALPILGTCYQEWALPILVVPGGCSRHKQTRTRARAHTHARTHTLSLTLTTHTLFDTHAHCWCHCTAPIFCTRVALARSHLEGGHRCRFSTKGDGGLTLSNKARRPSRHAAPGTRGSGNASICFTAQPAWIARHAR